jgi:hypothetical protein
VGLPVIPQIINENISTVKANETGRFNISVRLPPNNTFSRII